MDKNIKERWEAIDQGLVPKGYKKTKVGIVPEDWDVKKLGEIADINKENLPNLSSELDCKKFYYYDLSSVNVGEIYKPKNKIKYDQLPSRAKRLFERDNILFSTVRPNLKGFAYIDFDVIDSICSTGFAVLDIKKGFVSKYIYFNLFSKKIENRINSLTVGSNYPALNLKEVKGLKIPIPPLEEQERIAYILSNWDRAIESYGKLLEEKKERKKGLMQLLLTGEKRLGGFSGPWKEVRLGDVIEEINERTTENNQYPIISVTKDGIMLQSEYFNKQIASEDNIGYKIINKGNLVFSTMNLWMGSLDILEIIDKGIVSPAYKVFSIDEDNNDISFMKEFMKSNKMIWIYNMNSEQGASVVRRNLDLKGLLLNKIYVPYLEEQKAIADVIFTADREIDLLEKLIEGLEEEKKGLMQLLLKGIVRV